MQVTLTIPDTIAQDVLDAIAASGGQTGFNFLLAKFVSTYKATLANTKALQSKQFKSLPGSESITLVVTVPPVPPGNDTIGNATIGNSTLGI